MILGFKQYFPWKGEDGKPEPTYFKEKIITGAMVLRTPKGGLLPEGTPSMPNLPIPFIPKIHTFREDPHNRWKAGMKVSMVYRGAGYQILDWFNEGIPELGTIKSIQNIKISCTGMPKKGGYNPELYWPKIEVDGKVIGFLNHSVLGKDASGEACYIQTDKTKVLRLVQNDGFNSITEFCKFFNKDWSGKILHFTDFRYE